MTTSSRALVLSGGGNAGQAWMAGIISGLRELGTDLGDADLIVGTSAGARTGAQLATGALDQVMDMYRRSGVPAVTVHDTRRSARCKRHGPRVPAALPDRHAPRDAGHARGSRSAP